MKCYLCEQNVKKYILFEPPHTKIHKNRCETIYLCLECWEEYKITNSPCPVCGSNYYE